MNDTDQLQFWKGDFGAEYSERNAITDELLRPRLAFWSKILDAIRGAPPRSILEVGANVGLNLAALQQLSPADLHATEPNDRARAIMIDNGFVPAERVSDATTAAIPLADGAVDMVFTYCVLTHVAQEHLLESCRELHRVTGRYLLTVEYFSRNLETVAYRGSEGQIFKRDFGSFWLEHFDDLEIVDCGFCWKPLTGLDDVTWWLFCKT